MSGPAAPAPQKPVPAPPKGGVSSSVFSAPTKAPPPVPSGGPNVKLPAPPKQRAYAKSSVDVAPRNNHFGAGGPPVPPNQAPRGLLPSQDASMQRPVPQGPPPTQPGPPAGSDLGTGPSRGSLTSSGGHTVAPVPYSPLTPANGQNESPTAVPPNRPVSLYSSEAAVASPRVSENSNLHNRRNTLSAAPVKAQVPPAVPPKTAPLAPPSPSSQPRNGFSNPTLVPISATLGASGRPPQNGSPLQTPATTSVQTPVHQQPQLQQQPDSIAPEQSPILRRPSSGGISPAQSPRLSPDSAEAPSSMVRRSSSDEIRASKSLQPQAGDSSPEQTIPVRRTHSASVSAAVRSPSGKRIVVTPRSLAAMMEQDLDQTEVLASLPAPVSTRKPPPPLAKSPSISAIPPPLVEPFRDTSVPSLPPPIAGSASVDPTPSERGPSMIPPPLPQTDHDAGSPVAHPGSSVPLDPATQSPPLLNRALSGMLPTRIGGATPAPLSPIITQSSQRQRAASALPSLSDADSGDKKRARIVKELYDTEASYVSSLQTTMDHFIRPLKSAFVEVKKLAADKLEKEKTVLAVTPDAFDELSTLFLTWETILGCHIQFRDALTVPSDAGADAQIGSIVLENTKFIKLYRHYVNSYDKIMAAITTCSRNPAFSRFVDGLLKKPEFKGLTLYAYLIMPVQRVPRYVLLLSDLLKNTPESNPDHEPIKTALDLVKAFADFINTNKAAAENREKLDLLRSRITDTDGVDLEALVKGRRVIKHGELKVKPIIHNGEKDGESFEAFAFLTDDQLILAKIQKRGDQPKSKLRLVIKVHGNVTLENEKELSFAAASGDKYIFKAAAEAHSNDLNDWRVQIEAQAKEAIVRLMKNEDHLFSIVESDATDSAISEEDRKKKQYLARQKVASEIFEKEQEYTKKLSALADWIGRLRASNNRDLISAEEIVLCFSNIEAIANAHRDIFNLLKPKMENWTNDSTIGDVYREKLDYFKLYRPYALTFPTLAPNFSQQQVKHPLFIMMVAEFEKTHKSECGTIESIFPLPLRRVESLNALMKELLRNTPKDHADYGHLVWVTKTLNEREEELKKASTPEPVGRTRSGTVNPTTKDKKKK
eukprot:TRINITY_DN2142_c0_g1_i1.p1 TRINITY_DN2142_c0_g1~~TRINITY_DN2142_c0_g1_i1.p1  ORF type:complete len:1105 (+),score=150.38 TRINITY_DN2142_c0_g1_i1:151-3465(+)